MLKFFVLSSSAAQAGAFLVGPVRLAPAASRACGALRMAEEGDDSPNLFEEYRKNRGEASFEAAEKEYNKFKGMNQEFDGGDSGGGVVGDGNTDLEDQHNSATLGALRGGIADVTEATMSVGRGNVMFQDEGKVEGATEARTASAGANYFGRSTGLADKIIEEMTEDRIKTGRVDKVRAQQKENWFNQRAIHNSNRAQGQGVVFGETQENKPSSGGYIARESLSSAAWRGGAKESEISQKDLGNHMKDLAAQPADRLDGEEWGELTADCDITETFSVRSSPRQTSVTNIDVRNDLNTFAPYRCEFLPGSSSLFSATPNAGTMNRRSGEPVEVVVRYQPQATGEVSEATLVFETEDMKKVYKFIGST